LGEVLVVQDVLSNQLDFMILTLLHSGDETLTLFEVIPFHRKSQNISETSNWSTNGQFKSLQSEMRSGPFVRTCESPF